MSGAVPQASASGYINQCQFIDSSSSQGIIKALRACTGQWKVVAPTTVTSSTVAVAEPELFFPMKAGQKYVLQGYFLISSAAAGGAKVAISSPNNTTAASVISGKSLASGTASIQATLGNVTGAANQTLNGLSIYNNAQLTDELEFQLYIVPAIDDMLTFTFAQNTSNATASVLLQGSWANLFQMGGSTRRAPNGV